MLNKLYKEYLLCNIKKRKPRNDKGKSRVLKEKKEEKVVEINREIMPNKVLIEYGKFQIIF